MNDDKFEQSPSLNNFERSARPDSGQTSNLIRERITRACRQGVGLFIGLSSVLSIFVDELGWSRFIKQIVSLYKNLVYPVYDLFSFVFSLEIPDVMRDLYSALYSAAICWIIAYGDVAGTDFLRKFFNKMEKSSKSAGNPILQGFFAAVYFILVPMICALLTPLLYGISIYVVRMRPVLLGAIRVYFNGLTAFFLLAALDYYYTLARSNWINITTAASVHIPAREALIVLGLNAVLLIVVGVGLLISRILHTLRARNASLVDLLNEVEVLGCPEAGLIFLVGNLNVQVSEVRLDRRGDMKFYFMNKSSISLGLRASTDLRLNLLLCKRILIVELSCTALKIPERVSCVPLGKV